MESALRRARPMRPMRNAEPSRQTTRQSVSWTDSEFVKIAPSGRLVASQEAWWVNVCASKLKIPDFSGTSWRPHNVTFILLDFFACCVVHVYVCTYIPTLSADMPCWRKILKSLESLKSTSKLVKNTWKCRFTSQ